MADRRDATAEKLLTAAITVFGQYGFHGATTRMLAEEAGVNLQAIPYYFGGKEGLYLATAEHVGTAMANRTADIAQNVTNAFAREEEAGEPLSEGEARHVLIQLLQALLDFVVSDQSEAWARFVAREQMAPTEAFDRIYRAAMGPILDIVSRLVGTILSKAPEDEQVRLHTLSLMGSIIVYRMSRATALRALEWKTVGLSESNVLRAHVADLVASLGRAAAYQAPSLHRPGNS